MKKSSKYISIITVALTFLFIAPAVSAVFRPGKVLRETREAVTDKNYTLARHLADSLLSHTDDPLIHLETLQMLADVYRAIGEYPSAEGAYDKAAALLENSDVFPGYSDPSTPDGENYSNLMLNRAQLEIALGRYDQAALSLGKSVFPTGSEGFLRRKGALASLEYRRGNSADAVAILDEAIAEAGDSPTLPILLQNRGFILQSMDWHEDAVADFKMALKSLSGVSKGFAQGNLALALSGAGHHQEALAEIEEALGLLKAEVGDKSEDYLIALRKKGEILLRAGRRDESAKIMGEFFKAEKDRIVHTLSAMPRPMRLDYWTKEKPLLSRVFMIGDADPELLLDVALTRREISLPSLQGDATIREAGREEAFRALDKGEAGVAFILYPDIDGKDTYGAVTYTSSGDVSFVRLFDADFIDADVATDASIGEAIAEEDPFLKNVLYSDQVLGERIWRPVIESLPADIDVIRFVPEGVFHLWGIESMPFRDSERFTLIRQSSLLAHPDRVSDGKDRSVFSSEALVAGGLDYDAVPEYHTSPEKTNTVAYSELTRGLGLTDPKKVFSYLPGTADEASQVASTLSASELRNVMSEEDFKEEAPRFSRMHLATHGYSLDCGVGAGKYLPSDSLAVDISLLRSGLALSGANVLGREGSRDDGIISAREICELDLSDTDLIVLSACQTAKGYITDENASGLVRALKIAGVSTILATLWEVDDRATSLFMTEFYRRLGEGEATLPAFNGAKAYLRNYGMEVSSREFNVATMSGQSTGVKVIHPYESPVYWAPFILIDP